MKKDVLFPILFFTPEGSEEIVKRYYQKTFKIRDGKKLKEVVEEFKKLRGKEKGRKVVKIAILSLLLRKRSMSSSEIKETLEKYFIFPYQKKESKWIRYSRKRRKKYRIQIRGIKRHLEELIKKGIIMRRGRFYYIKTVDKKWVNKVVKYFDPIKTTNRFLFYLGFLVSSLPQDLKEIAITSISPEKIKEDVLNEDELLNLLTLKLIGAQMIKSVDKEFGNKVIEKVTSLLKEIRESSSRRIKYKIDGMLSIPISKQYIKISLENLPTSYLIFLYATNPLFSGMIHYYLSSK